MCGDVKFEIPNSVETFLTCLEITCSLLWHSSLCCFLLSILGAWSPGLIATSTGDLLEQAKGV